MVLNKSRKLPRLLYEIQDVNISGAKDKCKAQRGAEAAPRQI